jgi:hypothetical protein
MRTIMFQYHGIPDYDAVQFEVYVLTIRRKVGSNRRGTRGYHLVPIYHKLRRQAQNIMIYETESETLQRTKLKSVVP